MVDFSLREVKSDDHEFLASLHNDPVVLRNLTHPLPITLEQHMKWWNKIKHDPFQERLIFCVDGERAGFCKFYNIDRGNNNCVLGADLHEKFRGKGYAKPMWKLMIDRCFNVHELHRISLTTAEYNTVAQKVYRDLGFIEEGRLVQSLHRDGTYHDQILMFMLRETND